MGSRSATYRGMILEDPAAIARQTQVPLTGPLVVPPSGIVVVATRQIVLFQDLDDLHDVAREETFARSGAIDIRQRANAHRSTLLSRFLSPATRTGATTIRRSTAAPTRSSARPVGGVGHRDGYPPKGQRDVALVPIILSRQAPFAAEGHVDVGIDRAHPVAHLRLRLRQQKPFVILRRVILMTRRNGKAQIRRRKRGHGRTGQIQHFVLGLDVRGPVNVRFTFTKRRRGNRSLPGGGEFLFRIEVDQQLAIQHEETLPPSTQQLRLFHEVAGVPLQANPLEVRDTALVLFAEFQFNEGIFGAEQRRGTTGQGDFLLFQREVRR